MKQYSKQLEHVRSVNEESVRHSEHGMKNDSKQSTYFLWMSKLVQLVSRWKRHWNKIRTSGWTTRGTWSALTEARVETTWAFTCCEPAERSISLACDRARIIKMCMYSLWTSKAFKWVNEGNFDTRTHRFHRVSELLWSVFFWSVASPGWNGAILPSEQLCEDKFLNVDHLSNGKTTDPTSIAYKLHAKLYTSSAVVAFGGFGNSSVMQHHAAGWGLSVSYVSWDMTLSSSGSDRLMSTYSNRQSLTDGSTKE